MSCVFCDITNGLLPTEIVWENEYCMAFAPLNVEVDGHLLIVPKAHYYDITDIDVDVLGEVITFVKECCLRIKNEFGYEGFNLLNANGKVAHQSVFHFHIHILPRKEGDGVDAWPKLGSGKNIYATSHNKF